MRIFEPLLTRLVRSGTLTAAVLTVVDVDFDMGAREAVLLYGMQVGFEPSTITNADDKTVFLVGRPGYQVISATDFLEPMADPDIIIGQGWRTSFSTNGGMVEPLISDPIKIPEPYLLMRNLSAVFFDDNAVELQVIIYYKAVELQAGELFAAIARGRR